MTRPLSIAALCALAAVGAGCGDLGGDTRPKPKRLLVTQAQLERFPEGGPARGFLGWFRALQVSDSKAAARYYSPSLRITAREVAVLRKGAAHAVDSLASPRIVRVERHGSRAAVVARFRTGEIAPNGRVDLEDKQAVSFVLRRERGSWRLTDNNLLELISRSPAGPQEPGKRAANIVVSRTDLAGFPKGGPARAVLGWVRALQRGETAAVARYYAPAVKITGRGIARQREAADSFVRRLAVPRIKRVRVNGSRAVVTLIVRTARARPGGLVEVGDRGPAVFELRRIKGTWKRTDNGFLEILSGVPSS